MYQTVCMFQNEDCWNWLLMQILDLLIWGVWVGVWMNTLTPDGWLLQYPPLETGGLLNTIIPCHCWVASQYPHIFSKNFLFKFLSSWPLSWKSFITSSLPNSIDSPLSFQIWVSIPSRVCNSFFWFNQPCLGMWPWDISQNKGHWALVLKNWCPMSIWLVLIGPDLIHSMNLQGVLSPWSKELASGSPPSGFWTVASILSDLDVSCFLWPFLALLGVLVIRAIFLIFWVFWP